MEKKISFLFPCLNEEQGIGICIDKALSVVHSNSLNAEIIVIDNGSTDNSASVARSRGARVVFEKERVNFEKDEDEKQ